MGHPWIVAIPSYRRPALVLTKTLKTLRLAGVPQERITVYVADEAQLEAYRAAGVTGWIQVGVPGLAAQRQFIQEQWPVGQKIVFMDDDISQVKRLVGTRLEKVTDIPSLFDEAFRAMETAGANIWGVYPAASALYMSDNVATNLCYLPGGLFGIQNTRGPTLRYGDNQEDKERTLRYWKRDGIICRLNYVTILTRNYGPGGMDTPTRKAETQEATQKLVEEFPGLVKQIHKAKHGIYDIKFKRITPYRTLPPEQANTRIDVLPLVEGYEEARATLLRELQKIRIPTLGRPTKPYRRVRHGSRVDIIGSIGRSATFGFGNTRARGINEFAPNTKWPEVLKAMIDFGNLIAPEGWDYTTITLNHGVQAIKHKDSRNVGRSIIVGIGDYEGGSLRVWDPNDENPQDLDIKDKPTMFNGALLSHETQPFTGQRYTIIYYRQQWKGACKGMPPMIGAPKTKPMTPLEDGGIRTCNEAEGVSDELFGGCEDSSTIHVL